MAAHKVVERTPKVMKDFPSQNANLVGARYELTEGEDYLARFGPILTHYFAAIMPIPLKKVF